MTTCRFHGLREGGADATHDSRLRYHRLATRAEDYGVCWYVGEGRGGADIL